VGYDVGASGAWGLLLSQFKGELDRKLYHAVYRALHKARHDYPLYEMKGAGNLFEADFLYERLEPQQKPLIADFKARCKIIVPRQAELFWTGDADSRPGRTATPADDLVFGFGLYAVVPGTYPTKLHPSFIKAAAWHTWVWGG
jgi:hypothetical protein